MKASGPIPCLDGLRAIAVAIVFFSHAGLNHIVPGDLGVTIFFVLSGYLITTLMRKEVAEDGRINIPAFYLRRALRLYPALLIAVALSLSLSALSLSTIEPTTAGVVSILGYYSNYWILWAWEGSGIPVGLGITWSLAVEEHFYLLYPLVAGALLVLPPRRRMIGIGLIALAFTAWRAVLAIGFGVGEPYLKFATDTRIDAILWGCFIAVAANPWLDAQVRRRPTFDVLLGAAALVMLLVSLLVRDELFRDAARNGLRAIALVPVMYLVVLYGNHWITAPLRWSWMVWLGQVSYMFYLTHDQLLNALRDSAPQLPGWQQAAIALVASLIVCELTRRFVEIPVGRWRKRLHHASSTANPRAPAAPHRPFSADQRV